jgi:hypothetical protein
LLLLSRNADVNAKGEFFFFFFQQKLSIKLNSQMVIIQQRCRQLYMGGIGTLLTCFLTRGLM